MGDESQHHILVVEDSDEDFVAITRALDKAGVHQPIFRCLDGDDALDYLYGRGRHADSQQALRPSLILLDLNLPGTDGREALDTLKRDEQLRAIPVVVLTTSSNPKDVADCYQAGIASYIVKPVNFGKFQRSMQLFGNYWFEAVVLPDSSERKP